MSLQQQDIIGLTKRVILYFKAAGAVRAGNNIRDISKDKMETVLILPQGFY